ncbi:hypothetical protein ACFQ69_34900 [Streptomyces sp. NPDC056470]|uniref:hypothetical protein n=1 Tax=Streptomyces sp. NPDC056470 TaxID=3345831 RepID=UPI0036774F12
MPLLTPPRSTRAGSLAALRRNQRFDAILGARMAGRRPTVVLYTTSTAARPVLVDYARLSGWQISEDAFFDRPGSTKGLAMACAATESPLVDGILTLDRRMLPPSTDTYERTLHLLGRYGAFLEFVPPLPGGAA